MKPFEQVVTEHGATVLRVCRAVVGPVDAEDAWSETFLSALRRLSAVGAGGERPGLAVTIAHRKAIDVLRRRARLPVPVAELPERPTRDDDGADPDLVTAVQALPDRQRQAVAYHYLGGLPYAELARIIGGTPEAARRAAADGIKKLRLTYPNLERNAP